MYSICTAMLQKPRRRLARRAFQKRSEGRSTVHDDVLPERKVLGLLAMAAVRHGFVQPVGGSRIKTGRNEESPPTRNRQCLRGVDPVSCMRNCLVFLLSFLINSNVTSDYC